MEVRAKRLRGPLATALLALALSAFAAGAASADEPPSFGGEMSFPAITGPEGGQAGVVQGSGRQRSTATATAATPRATVAAAPEAASSTPQRVLVTRDLGDDQLFFRPHQFVLSGDGTFGISQVKWKRYGGAVATATGVAFVNDCEPNCAEGTFSHPAAKLRLSPVVDCNGVDIYARLSYKLTGSLPSGLGHQGSFAMRPRDETGGFEC